MLLSSVPCAPRGRRRAPVLAALLALSAPLAPVLAQSTIVITGSREPERLERLAGDLVVVDEAQLREAAGETLADVLRRTAGVQLSRTGGPGQSSGLFVRGANAQHTLVLVDGVRIGSATLGLAGLESLPLAQVERVEVLRGPGSSLYGSDAVGGVVQVFTRRGGAPSAALALGVGGLGSGEASASLGGRGAGVDWSFSASRERSRGVSALRPGDRFGNHNPDDDGYGLSSVQARLGVVPVAGHRLALSLMANWLDAQYDGAEFGPPDYAPDPSPDFRNRQRSATAALEWKGDLAPGWVASARASRSTDDLRSGASLPDRFRTERDQVAAQLSWSRAPFGELVVAAERLQERASSSSYADDARRDTGSLVLAASGRLGTEGSGWQGELRHDDSREHGGQGTARLGGRWPLAPGWSMRALVGTTFRAPSFNDLVFPGYGVPTLAPERGRSAELGLDWRREGTVAAATLWRNRVRDLVGYEPDAARCPPDPSYAYGCARNVAQARLQGLTVSASGRQGLLGWQLQLDWLDATDVATGQRLQRRAAQQHAAGVDWTVGRVTYGANLLRLGARPDGGATLAAETTLDLSARWAIARELSLQARLLNATDRELEPVRDYQGLPRQAWLVLRWQPRG